MVKYELEENADGAAFEQILGTMEKRRFIQGTRSLRSVFIAVAMIAVLLSVLWYSYPREAIQQEIIAAPIIRADAGMYKVVPEDPGGMAIPYRDSTIFDTFQAGNNKRKIEFLLPEEEPLIARDDLFVDLKEDIIETEMEEVSAVDEVIEEITDQQQIASVSIVAPEEIKVLPPIPSPAELFDTSAEVIIFAQVPDQVKEQDSVPVIISAVTIPVPSEKPANSMSSMDYAAWRAGVVEPSAGTPKDTTIAVRTINKARYYVQLGSLRSQEAARREWGNLQSQFQNLQILGYRIRKADLGEHGIFYRLQAGPIDKAEARMLCDIVTAKRPGTCLVVRN